MTGPSAGDHDRAGKGRRPIGSGTDGPGGRGSEVGPVRSGGRGPDDRADRAWFARESLDVARDLLGAVLIHRTTQGTVAVRITETEAYRGGEDPASHAFRGPTPRNATMFGEAGRLYVYRHLGLHHCANVVTNVAGVGQAVLLRAGEVIEGADLARDRRRAAGVCRTDRDLARGPARLAVALALTRADDGGDLCPAGDGADRDRRGTGCEGGVGPSGVVGRSVVGSDGGAGLSGVGPSGVAEPWSGAGPVLALYPVPVPDSAVRRGPRVGVAGAGAEAAGWPYRFWIADDPHVSAYRP